METIVARLVEAAPEHEVLPGASRYDLRALRVSWTHGVSVVEIDVSTHETYKTLKFSGVENLYIPGGELLSSILLSIKSLANCENASHHIPPIRVGGTDAESNALRFWASAVEVLVNK